MRLRNVYISDEGNDEDDLEEGHDHEPKLSVDQHMRLTSLLNCLILAFVKPYLWLERQTFVRWLRFQLVGVIVLVHII